MAEKNSSVLPVLSTPVLDPSKVTNEVDAVTSDKVTTYLDADIVFNQLPVSTRDALTDLAKDKYSREVVAGHVTDKDMAGFRTQMIIDYATAAHKQLVKLQTARKNAKCAALYSALRERGISVAEASKASGYNPLV